jgi:4-hydroxy-tetrahydrodipicolinate reductase
MGQIVDVLKHRLPIVSTTEELAYPWHSNKRLARKIDNLARKAKVAVLGTGVNPGFAMDALPITLTGVCERVDSIRVERVQDASVRRLPFQEKIGAGLTRQQFDEKVKDGSVRHVGLTESVGMIADAMGWKLDRISDDIGPKLAARTTKSEFLTVQKGQVAGIIQTGKGYRDGEPLITLHMEAYLGAPEAYDTVIVKGVPDLHMKIAGGVHGDIATAAITVNSIPKVLTAPAGLQTMRSMAIPSWYGGRRK